MQQRNPPQSPKKFYFLDYFYVLLESIRKANNREEVLRHFLILKDKYQLGQSRYRKLTIDPDYSQVRLNYTFNQVIAEAESYHLIENKNKFLKLTQIGEHSLEIHEKHGEIAFYEHLFGFMENYYDGAFRYIVENCYQVNPEKGLLVFPTYSPSLLGIERSALKTSGDFKDYLYQLNNKLELDMRKFLSTDKDLQENTVELIAALVEANLISTNIDKEFDPNRYTSILKRVRDFWLRYFLKYYNFDISLPNFELWAFRGKQIGVLHITQFYPDASFSGRVVYPLSVIRYHTSSLDFKLIYEYKDTKKLYLHQPNSKNVDNQERFVQSLWEAYRTTRQLSNNYFVSLPSVRERVCYNMKIPGFLFDDFLVRVYENREQWKIDIALEVDRYPERTSLSYIHRDPIYIDGKVRNIIAIDLAKIENSYDRIR